MAGLRAGALNRLVSVQARDTTKDSFGGQVTTWTEVKQVWAQIETLSVAARTAAAALQTEVTHQITVRFDADLWGDPKLAATFRIVYGGRCFDIQGMDNQDERNRVVVLNAIEGLSPG